MILDTFEQASRYAALSPHFAAAFAFVRTVTDQTPLGRHEIAGDDAFGIVQQHATSALAGRLYEAHRRYVDVQCILRGRELIYWAPLPELAEVVMPFDEAKDAALFALSPAGQAIPVRAGQFAILFPADAHVPSVAWGDPAEVRKVVVKVRVP